MKKKPFRKGNRVKCKCCNQRGKIVSMEEENHCNILFDGHTKESYSNIEDLIHLPKKVRKVKK